MPVARGSLALVVLLVLHPSRPALAVAPEPIAPGVHLLRGVFVPGTQPDGNTVIFEGPEGLLVVDTGRHVAHTRAIVDFARARGKPIVAVVNSHWHLDHLGGNGLVRREFPQVEVWSSAALEGALDGFLARYRRDLESAVERTTDDDERARYRAELALLADPAVLASDRVVEVSGPQRLAGREVRLGLVGPAVTAGDVWLLDRESGVLVLGDLVTYPVPFLDTACPRGWLAAIEEIEEIEEIEQLEGTAFEVAVPGHGAPMTPAELGAYVEAFRGLLDCAESERSPEQCAGDWLAALGDRVPDEEHAFARSMLAYYFEQLRGDPERSAANCQ